MYLPDVCHPQRIRAWVRQQAVRNFLIVFNLLVFIGLCASAIFFFPMPSFSNAPLDPYSQSLMMEFPHETALANQHLKEFLDLLQISDNELLHIKIHEEKFHGIPYSHYQASFFLNSFAKGEQLLKTYVEHLKTQEGEAFHSKITRPMENFLVITVLVYKQETHEIMFYFPAKEDSFLSVGEESNSDFSRTRKKYSSPRIAIVIDDLGDNWSRINTLLSMDSNLAMSILPDTQFGLTAAKKAKEGGHPVFLHLPMEPWDSEKVNGSNFLMTDMEPEEIEEILSEYHELLSYCEGVNNHMGSRFTENLQQMNVVLNFLNKKKLFFLDSRTSNDTIGYHLAKELGLATGIRDVFLDHDRDPEAISQQFQVLRRIARKKGFAIAIGHPFSETIQVLKREIPLLKKEGFQIVPVTKI